MVPNSSTWRAATLLFFSGAAALVYQTVWMRDFRLIFGVSTFATGVVLAIFMGGLGLGSALLGRRADRHPHPLALYGVLEIGIAVSAAISPLLLMGIRWAYIAIGGGAALGEVLAILVRLIFSALVLLVPTVLMGGTLPAMARAVESEDDAGRRRLALLYGINTIGAVAGALVSTFILLERFGNRRTLWIAAAVNLAIGFIAYSAGRKGRVVEKETVEEPFRAAVLPAPFVLAAAAIVGFAFLLMELVWYRMLSPILGGTTFMFGLILAVALAGIGTGGAIYSFGRRDRTASAGAFALTCTLEALAMIVPFALGDRIAVLANALRSLEVFGFSGHLFGWTAVTFLVAFPAAAIAGYQFPLLISLLGRGRENVGREVGLTYAWNTVGAITASLLGGFVLVPWLGATGSWKLATGILLALGAATMLFAIRERRLAPLVVTTVAAIVAIGSMFAMGPTAVWRHSGIGAGRAPRPAQQNALIEWQYKQRRTEIFTADGRESSIGLLADEDLGLIVNGKSDGSARGDAGTQVMAGMIGALVHPDPKKALVVGLGTGTTSGWLAAIPSMERVDVVELEPVVVQIADYFSAVNRRAMDNEKMHVTVGDAREVLLTSREQYDLIFSEPSNPYRAGIASLYTREFYEAASDRLQPGGLFLQWVQMYSVDASTIQTIYATMTSVFPWVDTWVTTHGDVVLVASRDPLEYDVERMRKRLATEPHRSAAHAAWRVETVEGVFAHFLGSEKMAEAASARATELNTDDRPVIEFSFARTLMSDRFNVQSLASAATQAGAARPTNIRGNVDWADVEANRASLPYLPSNDPRYRFITAYWSGDLAGAAAAWRDTKWAPANSGQLAILAHALANSGDESAMAYVEQLRPWQPTEADAIEALLRARQNNPAAALPLMASALTKYRTDPWPMPFIMGILLTTAVDLASTDPALAATLLEPLSRPYAAYQQNDERRRAYLAIAWQARRCSPATLATLRELEPAIPWRLSVLQIRATCYNAAGLRDAAEANEDLRRFLLHEPQQLIQ